MRTNTTPAPIDEEIVAQQAEARKAVSEGEFVILSEDKKRLVADSKELELEIENSNKILRTVKDEIIVIGNKISDIKNLHTEEQKKLNNITKDKQKEEEAFQDFQKEIYKKKEELNSEIQNLGNDYISKKAEKEKDLHYIQSSIVLSKDESKKIESILTELKNQEVVYLKKNQELKDINEGFISIKESFESTIEKQKQAIEENKESINNQKLAINGLDLDISLKQKEITKISIDISSKKEEYKLFEMKMFAFAAREDTLSQKEEYIKAQYERAGVKWEE